jgi:O-antigen/teichoic acid export membrane protein
LSAASEREEDRGGWIRRRLDAWRRWSGRLAASVADQGLIAGSQFLLNVLLARGLGPAGYGEFSVGFVALLVVAGLHSALVIEPMSALGPARDPSRRPAYVGQLVFLTTIGAAALALAGIFLYVLFGGGTMRMGVSVLGMAIALGPMLVAALVRQACYLEMRPRLAVAGGVVYATVLLGTAALVFARREGPPSVLAGYVPLALAGVSSSIVLGVRLRLGLPDPARRSTWGDAGRLLPEHWTYGRWIFGASLAHTVGYLLYVPMVGAILGLSYSGILRALQTLTMPLVHLLSAYGLLLVPWISRQHASQGPGYTLRAAGNLLLLNLATASAFALAMLALGRPLLAAVYGPAYSAFAWALAPLALAAWFAAASEALGTLVRGMRRPDLLVRSKLAAAAVTLAVGLAAIRSMGFAGAVFSLAVGSLCEALVLAWCLWRRR